MGGAIRTVKKRVVRDKKTYLPINQGSAAAFRYKCDDTSDTGEDRREKRYFQKEKGYRKSGGKKTKQKKYRDPSDSNRSYSNSGCDDKPDWKKGQSHCSKIKDCRRVFR